MIVRKHEVMIQLHALNAFLRIVTGNLSHITIIVRAFGNLGRSDVSIRAGSLIIAAETISRFQFFQDIIVQLELAEKFVLALHGAILVKHVIRIGAVVSKVVVQVVELVVIVFQIHNGDIVGNLIERAVQ